MKKILCGVFASLIASNAFGEVAWVESDLSEADILNKYQDKILHISTSTFSSTNNDLVTTIVTTSGSFRCARSLPSKAEKIVASLVAEKAYCAMTKADEEEAKGKKKKRKKKKKKKDK